MPGTGGPEPGGPTRAPSSQRHQCRPLLLRPQECLPGALYDHIQVPPASATKKGRRRASDSHGFALAKMKFHTVVSIKRASFHRPLHTELSPLSIAIS